VVAITSPPARSQSAADLITAQARITDKGKRIGRIEWRVNGVTVGVTNALQGVGPDYEVEQDLALDLGENTIEVVAYNQSNLLASLPAETTITFTGSADTVRAKLYVRRLASISMSTGDGSCRKASPRIFASTPCGE
jgi:hypothetical protein